MESKLLILLACVTLARGTYVPQLLVSYGLSDARVEVVNKIMTNQEATAVAFKNAVNSLFNVLDWLETGAYDRCSPFTNVFDLFKASANTTLDSIPLIFERATVEDARNKMYGYIDDANQQFFTALIGAQYAIYQDNTDTIQENLDAVERNFEDVIGTIYDVISSNQGTADADAVAVIEKARDGSILGISHVLHAIFNKVKLYAAEVKAGCTFKSFAPYSREFRAKALAGSNDVIEYAYSLLKALVIKAEVDKDGILSDLFENQYAYAVQYRGYKDGNLVLFDDVLYSHFKRYNFSFYDDGDIDFSLYDAALNTVIADFDIGDRSILNFFAILNPDYAESITEIKAEIHEMNVAGDVAFFDALATATATDGVYDDIIAKIAEYRNAAVSPAPQYTDIFYKSARGNKTYSAETESKLASLQNDTIIGARLSVNNYFDGVLALLDAKVAGAVTDADITGNSALLDGALYGVDLFSQTMSGAAFWVLLEQIANEAEE